MSNDYNRSIELVCPLCGNKDFSYDETDETSPVTCTQCNTTYTREDLMEQNQELISANFDEVKEEMVKDLKKNIKEIFKGNKYISIK